MSGKGKNVDIFLVKMLAKVMQGMPEYEGIHVIEKLCGEE